MLVWCMCHMLVTVVKHTILIQQNNGTEIIEFCSYTNKEVQFCNLHHSNIVEVLFVSDNKSQYLIVREEIQAEVDSHDPIQEKIVELLNKTRGARINGNLLAQRYGMLREQNMPVRFIRAIICDGKEWYKKTRNLLILKCINHVISLSYHVADIQAKANPTLFDMTHLKHLEQGADNSNCQYCRHCFDSFTSG